MRKSYVYDEAYSALSTVYNNQIIIAPYSSYQLNTSTHNDDLNETGWKHQIKENFMLTARKQVGQYWKMWAFNHEQSSEQVTAERRRN